MLKAGGRLQKPIISLSFFHDSEAGGPPFAPLHQWKVPTKTNDKEISSLTQSTLIREFLNQNLLFDCQRKSQWNAYLISFLHYFICMIKLSYGTSVI